jgi:hypothetical protein
LKILSNLIGNKLSEHLLEVLMNDVSTLDPDFGLSLLHVLLKMLEDGKAEPDNPFIRFCRDRGPWRVNTVKNVIYAADKQLVFVSKVRIEG